MQKTDSSARSGDMPQRFRLSDRGYSRFSCRSGAFGDERVQQSAQFTGVRDLFEPEDRALEVSEGLLVDFETV